MKKFHNIFAVLLLIISVDVWGQDPPPPPPPPVDEPPTPGWVPIDGGLAALLAAGVGYGAKKAYDYRSKRQKKSTNTLD